MALEKKHSISTFITKFLWILCLVFQEFNLVICDYIEDDSLKNALEAIERRHKDLELQENEYYGQPENIGYGFHKTLGFFDNNSPAAELETFDSNVKNDFLNYANYQKENDVENNFQKRKSNFRERISNSKIKYLVNDMGNNRDYSLNKMEYLQLLKSLWSKYRRSRPDDINIEDLTDEQVEEILNSLYENENHEERFGNDYRNPEPNTLEAIPIKNRKGYRIFEGFNEKKKRNPSFGKEIHEGNFHSQNINYESPSENDFLYSLKYVNPEFNREAVENLREEGFEVLGDEKDKDIIQLINSAVNRPKFLEEDQPYWLKDQSSGDEDDFWLQGPIVFSEDGYENLGRNEKRNEFATKFFKNHNGIQVNTKRFPVKRSPVQITKEVKNKKVSKELKGIFGTMETTTVRPKNINTKKFIEVLKKQNATKPEVLKHHEIKKVVRRADKYTQEQALPVYENKEIADIFNVKKKNIDWSQYFGLDKRSNWLKNNYLRKAEEHFMVPKNKRLSLDRANVGNVNFLDQTQYEMPFDTRKFNKKKNFYDTGNNINKIENKIGDIEEKIINDAIKYTGAHSGSKNENLSRIKHLVIQHLEAAYSLEKIKNALEEFKNLIKPEKNIISGKSIKKPTSKAEPQNTVSKGNPPSEKLDKKQIFDASKRVITKKEPKKILSQESADDLKFLNVDDGNRQYEDEACPILDKILHNCLRIEEIGGKFAEVLAPLCTLQQICYFCGTEISFLKMSMCDSMYLTEAQNICQGDGTCVVNARNSVLALQDLYEQDLMKENSNGFLSGSCLSNPCIQRYFLNSLGAVYPLEVQN